MKPGLGSAMGRVSRISARAVGTSGQVVGRVERR
jgi:hypothetical protein